MSRRRLAKTSERRTAEQPRSGPNIRFDDLVARAREQSCQTSAMRSTSGWSVGVADHAIQPPQVVVAVRGRRAAAPRRRRRAARGSASVGSADGWLTSSAIDRVPDPSRRSARSCPAGGPKPEPTAGARAWRAVIGMRGGGVHDGRGVGRAGWADGPLPGRWRRRPGTRPGGRVATGCAAGLAGRLLLLDPACRPSPASSCRANILEWDEPWQVRLGAVACDFFF